jgi:hypothetical protein
MTPQRPYPGAAEDLAIAVARLATIELILREGHSPFCKRDGACRCRGSLASRVIALCQWP